MLETVDSKLALWSGRGQEGRGGVWGMKTVGCWTLLLGFAIFPLQVSAQDKHAHRTMDVLLCDLLSHPEQYSGEMVRVRAKVSFGFEDFTLSREGCPAPEPDAVAPGVWLEYGGDEGSPAIFCCGDHGRDPGRALEVEGHPIGLLRDASYWEFGKRLSPGRRNRPDGRACYGRECLYYEVTATITGHFFAMETTEETIRGYGHLGMFHLLFIEQVSDVEAKRTAVPAGGTYQCNSETLELPDSEVEGIVRSREACQGRESCVAAARRALAVSARYCNAPLGDRDSWKEGSGEEGASLWSSPDLLTSLEFRYPYFNPHIGTSRKSFSLVQTTCFATTPPLPQTAKVSCNSDGWHDESAEAASSRLQLHYDAGQDPWRTELKEAAWRSILDFARVKSIDLSPELAWESCDAYEFQGNEYASCVWATRDEMRTASAYLIRFSALASNGRPTERTIWAPAGGGVWTCKVE